jgi:hypothetical protein
MFTTKAQRGLAASKTILTTEARRHRENKAQRKQIHCRGAKDNKIAVKVRGHIGGGDHRGVKSADFSVAAASVRVSCRGAQRFRDTERNNIEISPRAYRCVRRTETPRKATAKSKPEGTEEAEDTEDRVSGCERRCGWSLRESPRRERIVPTISESFWSCDSCSPSGDIGRVCKGW